MNMDAVETIANAVLYEGYLLYPYRSSAVKNQRRFNFGVLYPPSYCEAQGGSDASEMKTECLLSGSTSSTIEVKVRFLQMIARGQLQEGHERDVCGPVCTLGSLITRPFRHEFTFEALRGEIELHASQLHEDLFRITLMVGNRVRLDHADRVGREDILLRSLVSVHSIVAVAAGEFVSLLDPPEHLKEAAASCQQAGAWPVLVGEEGQRDMILAAPIILYDYPRIAPESAGDLFDGTEIDEILALRILTMTDAEKLEVRTGDDRARRILERTEMLPPEHFQKLHGALRGLGKHDE
jgi:hydrogenase maturation protease